MLSFSQVKSAGSAGNYYTEKDNYYVIGSMEERWPSGHNRAGAYSRHPVSGSGRCHQVVFPAEAP
jgi:hypothetical protein